MLNALLAHKTAIGWILSMVGATVTVVVFEYFLELSWYISVPVGALTYVTMPMLWSELLNFLVLRSRR